jgi:hypothetical protein
VNWKFGTGSVLPKKEKKKKRKEKKRKGYEAVTLGYT